MPENMQEAVFCMKKLTILGIPPATLFFAINELESHKYLITELER